MGTAITPTLLRGPTAVPGVGYKATFELAHDSTDASGNETLDLTDYFYEVHTITNGGFDATSGYEVEWLHPGVGVAIAATTIKCGVFEAGVDGAALDAKAPSSMTSALAGHTIVVTGTRALPTSWA